MEQLAEKEGVLDRITFVKGALEDLSAFSDRSFDAPVSYTYPREVLVKIMDDPEQRTDFLDFCYRYDASPYVCGMGKDNLLAVGEL